MCAGVYPYIFVYVVRAKAFQSIGFLPSRSLWQAFACKNVTCQTTRIDGCSHSASFQSPLCADLTARAARWRGAAERQGEREEGWTANQKESEQAL